MEEQYHKRIYLADPNQLLKQFDAFQAKKMENFPTTIYKDARVSNTQFYEYIIQKNRYGDLPDIFIALRDQAFAANPGKMDNPSKWAKPGSFFDKAAMHYREVFKIGSKQFFEQLTALEGKDLVIVEEKAIEKMDDDDKLVAEKKNLAIRKYFRTFLSVSVFFCAFFRYKIVKNGRSYEVVKIPDPEKGKVDSREYYLFYNRSHAKTHGLGVGKVSVIENEVTVEYYYNPNDKVETVAGKKYATLKTIGEVERYPEARIMLFKNVQDDGTWEENKGFEGPAPVFSYFVLKHYKKEHEKILLGTHSSWNRNDSFPAATALVLIDKEYYDGTLDEKKEHSFEAIKNSRSEKILDRDKLIHPAIYYYLFHQTINLSVDIKGNQNEKGKAVPFSGVGQLPYFKEESQYLTSIEGSYKGLTVVSKEGEQILVISKLVIRPNGMVFLTISRKKEGEGEFGNPGFVKYITANANNRSGSLFINLLYNYEKRYNGLAYYLEYELTEADGERGGGIVLRGGYGGESLISHKPIGATIVFEKTADKSDFETEVGMFVHEGKKKVLNPRIKELYRANESLFQFYISGRSDQFSNHSGVDLLRRYLSNEWTDHEMKYDVFISIPLTHRNDEEEYLLNTRLVLAIVKGLVDELGFNLKKIFCACLDKRADGVDGPLMPLTYEEYGKQTETRNQIHKFRYMQNMLDKSRYVFVIFPRKTFNMGEGQYRLSSSVVELAYSLGAGKKSVLLCDKEEFECLPMNLRKLQEDSIFVHEITDEKGIHSFFEDRSNVDALKRQLPRDAG